MEKTKNTAPKIYQNGNCPPRQNNSSRCGEDRIAAPALKQGDSVSKSLSDDQFDILKNSICRELTNGEFEVFIMACKKTNLDPFMKQIYAVKRKSRKPDGTWGETMTIQTGIDGYRLIAERTGRYAPGPEPTYEYDANGNVISATAHIKKQTSDGTWHTVSSSAYMDEYCQTFQDKQTGQKKPNNMWSNLPRTMLSKCAEAIALRRAFPAEMSGVYTKEEMQQADNCEVVEVVKKISSPQKEEVPKIDIVQKISAEQADGLDMILSECDPKYKDWVYKTLKSQFNADTLYDVPVIMFERIKKAAMENMEATHEMQRNCDREFANSEGVDCV